MGHGSGGGFGVVGQVMGLDRWIGVSWVKWWRGFGSVEIGGFGSWRLVSFSIKIGGFLDGWHGGYVFFKKKKKKKNCCGRC